MWRQPVVRAGSPLLQLLAKDDPQFSEDCFSVIYRHTGGVLRQINTMCSRMLLFGLLEELHTLQAAVAEKVANDLRQEMAVVTQYSTAETSHAQPNGRSEASSEVAKRLSALEEKVNRHGSVIKRAIEIAAAYFQVEQP